jgi:hypothetical protein
MLATGQKTGTGTPRKRLGGNAFVFLEGNTIAIRLPRCAASDD